MFLLGPCSLSTLAVLFLTLAFKSSEAVTLVDGYLEHSKGQTHQTEPDNETLPSLWSQRWRCEGWSPWAQQALLWAS